MTTNHNEAWVAVFSGDAFEAEVVKGMLEANGIPCILEDHTSILLSPYSGVGGEMRILVDPSDEAEAHKLIARE